MQYWRCLQGLRWKFCRSCSYDDYSGYGDPYQQQGEAYGDSQQGNYGGYDYRQQPAQSDYVIALPCKLADCARADAIAETGLDADATDAEIDALGLGDDGVHGCQTRR